jgi:hypothetical protein
VYSPPEYACVRVSCRSFQCSSFSLSAHTRKWEGCWERTFANVSQSTGPVLWPSSNDRAYMRTPDWIKRTDGAQLWSSREKLCTYTVSAKRDLTIAARLTPDTILNPDRSYTPKLFGWLTEISWCTHRPNPVTLSSFLADILEVWETEMRKW